MNSEKIKLLLMNIPPGFENADITPAGISRVIEGLDKALDIQISFLDLDYLKLSLPDIEQRLRCE